MLNNIEAILPPLSIHQLYWWERDSKHLVSQMARVGLKDLCWADPGVKILVNNF